uniref:non-specific serine/threonine protein kinase n=1 Tax=Corvus moneduloides TaxID=1196302 RepID=A0A8C3E9S7_CORMO
MLLESSRSTFCAIISQLTEETQPLFETTIKSRAVSEDSDAKFTCIVTGYPQPEVTWYKDDEEMDRYCGLPKYEIFRHGNRHTLQLYKCREEDAGIYQASARNNKGIVSCSGVLEVGTMTEFKIHQKWFDKIKRKAEEKLQEIEQGKKRGKENVEVEKLQGMSPERLQRKRRLARDQNLRSGDSSWEKEDAETKEQPLNAVPGFPNKLVAPLKAEVTTNGDATLESGEENGNNFLTYIYETVEDLATKPGAKDSAAKKKKKVEAPSAAKQEVSKREESGRDRANPSSNPRFAPPVPLRRNARLRAASDQEVETSPKLKEPGKAVKQDTKTNDDVYFSLKDMYFDKQVKPAAGKKEVGAKDKAGSEAALWPVEVSRQTEDAPLVGQFPGDLKHPVSSPTKETSQQGSKVEEVRKEVPVCQETRGAVERTNPRFRPQEPPKPPAPSPDHVQSGKEHPPPRKQAERHSHALEGRETQQGLLNQEDKSQGGEESLLTNLSPPEPGENTPLEQIPCQTVKDGKSKEAGAELSGSHPGVRTAGSDGAKPYRGTVPREAGGIPLGHQNTEMAAPEPAASSGTWEGVSEVQPQVPLVLPGSERSQEMSFEEKMQHKNLVSSLKNYLLLLLKMSDSSKDATKGDIDSGDKEQPNAGEGIIPEIGIAGLSPRTSRKVLEKVQNNQLFQTAENLPLTPRTSRRITGMINEEFITSKEMLAGRPVPPKRRAWGAPEAEGPPPLSVPSIVVGSMPTAGVAPHLSDSPPVSSEESPADPLAVLPCATPEELALGARRKIYLPKPKQVGVEEEATPESLEHTRSPTVSPRQSRKNAPLLHSPSSPSEQCSPTLMRKMATLEVPKLYEEPAGDTSGDQEVPGDAKPEAQPAESQKTNNPFKAPQVVRKIRAEQFSDASGNLKLWCQFFNILSDSKLTWYKDEIPVAEAQRSAGDEGQAALAVVQASQKDCGVYRCVISNEYGTDSTDFLLSPEVLSGFILREEIEVGEEIEMTPMVFAKGLADAGYWGDKLFGRVVSEDMEVGAGFLRKACRARAIYGLEPVFESGHTCVIKVHNFIVFGTKNENSLIEKNYDITIQECKVQNSSREYCKIFAAEARAIPDFGAVPEIIPLYLIYRPANNIPYATMEEDLGRPCEQYCVTERDGSLVARGSSEIVLKCCTFQHWVYQWTNGNILVTDMEGVGWKLTNVRIATNLKGYQGLKESCFPSLLEQFPATHRCNHYCSILGLKMLEPAKPKGSKSPCLGRKSAQSSPQLQKKVLTSPQGTRKAAVSPKSSRRAAETGEAPTASKPRSGESNRAGCPQ